MKSPFRNPVYPLKMDVSVGLETLLLPNDTGWEIRDENGKQILDSLPFYPGGVMNITRALEDIRKLAIDNPTIKFLEVNGERVWERGT